MERFSLEVEKRSELGSVASRRYRVSGQVPSIVYSHGEESVAALVSSKALEKIGKQVRRTQIFILKSGESSLNGRNVIVKELQRDHISGALMHVDFQALKENEEITIRIPIKTVGEAPGVKNDGGVLTVLAHEVGVTCLPKFIPNEIQVDISALNIGNSVHAKDLVLPEGVKLHDDPEETIVSVVAVRVVEEAAPAATETPVEGAAAEGATAAPAEGTEAPKKEEKEKK